MNHNLLNTFDVKTMSCVPLSKDFKKRFNDISTLHMGKFLARLLTVFDTPELHYSRATLHSYYFKYPKIKFQKEIAVKNLLSFFDGRGITLGSVEMPSFTFVNRETLPTDVYPEGEVETYVLNWNNFFNLIESKFYESLGNIDEVLLFADRLPKTIREKLLSTPKVIVDGNGNLFESKYSFFDIKITLKYYEDLFAQYYSEYPLLPQFSNKKVKRYGASLGNGLFAGFSINYAQLLTELKYTYLEFPLLSLEIFSEELIHAREKDNYFFDSKDGIIEKIQFDYFMGHFSNNRIGNSSRSSKYLQNRMHFYFAVNSYYTKIYLEYVVSVLMAM